MKKSFIKTISIIIIFSMALAILIGAIATGRSTSFLAAEIDEKMTVTAEKFSNEFSAKFNHMEGMTDSVVSYVATTFNMEAFRENPVDYMNQYNRQLAKLIRNNLRTVTNAHSLYVTYNPRLTPELDEVWYAFVDGKINEISANFQNNKRDFTLPYQKEMAYFFEPQEKENGVWIEPYYDKDIKQEVFSYSRAIYVEGKFIGVAGADINTGDTVKVIKEMNVYPGGFSALLDENCGLIISTSGDAKEEKIITARLKKEREHNKVQRQGNLKYSYDNKNKIMAYSQMDNGWSLVIVQPEKATYKQIDLLQYTMSLLSILLAFALIAFLVAFTRPFIKKATTLEEENRKKEVMLIYQSRQAKIGEMVGNVTHQWKQPLNTINLILANLLDSYQFGDLDENKLEKSVRKAENIVDKMSETITDFSDFLKPTKSKDYFKVENCVKSAISLMEESLNLHKIKVYVLSETQEQAYGYYNEATHVFFNLLNNARDAIVVSCSPKRVIQVQITLQDNMVKTSIINMGERILPEIEAHLFEPYFTTKEDMGGTGLGLYISDHIIRQRMSGRLVIKNIAGGVQCDVLIPVKPGKEDENEWQ